VGHRVFRSSRTPVGTWRYRLMPGKPRRFLEQFRPVLEDEGIEKVGHNLKYDLSVLKWLGLNGLVENFFDTMVAHSLVEPDMRPQPWIIFPRCIWATPPVPITRLIGEAKGRADQPVGGGAGIGGGLFRRGRGCGPGNCAPYSNRCSRSGGQERVFLRD